MPVLDGINENTVKVVCKLNKNTGEFVSRIFINPHNYYSNNNREILEYSLFEKVMTELTERMELHEWQYSRIDVRLDSYENNYQEYFKLNALFIDLFTMAYIFKNGEATESMGHRSRSKCGVYIKNQNMSVDYYDKNKESRGKFPCKARLEFRMMKLNGKSPTDVIKVLFRRFENLDSYYHENIKECNKSLLRNYKWTKKNRPLKDRNDILTPYIWENQDVFYNMKQLECFCKMCGVGNPAVRAKSIARKTCKIEFISKKNISDYIAIIKNFITQYMES